MKDFWVSSGHHLLDRGSDGGLHVTDEFIKLYLARPELLPPPDALPDPLETASTASANVSLRE